MMAAIDVREEDGVSMSVRIVVALIAGLLIGGAAVWALSGETTPGAATSGEFYVLTGETTNVSYDRTQFGFVQEPIEHPEIGLDGFQGFSSADVEWRYADEDTWNSGTPECLQPGMEGHPVKLGVFHGYDGQVTGRGYSVLAWMIC